MKKRQLVPLAATAALALALAAGLSACSSTGTSTSNGGSSSSTESSSASSSSASSSSGMAQSSSSQAEKISAEQAKAMMDKGGVTVVDVRTADEYAQGHVPDALLLINEKITEASAQELLPNKDADILVYCRSGRRSAEAAAKLVSYGYTHVYDFGGIIDWPYDTVTGEFTR